MDTLLIIGIIAFVLSLCMLIYKEIEVRFGMPHVVVYVRGRSDESIEFLHKRVYDVFSGKKHEFLEATSRIPHLLIHLAYVLRDKFRVRFSHYIDEVKGRKPMRTIKPTKSEYLNAVKDHVEENERGEIH